MQKVTHRVPKIKAMKKPKRQYTPRRASLTRWLEGAPDYILDVFDTPKYADRYTVLFTGDLLVRQGASFGKTHIQYLGMSGRPTHPQGVSMWGEFSACAAAAYRARSGKRRIRWLDLPKEIQEHVIARATEK